MANETLLNKLGGVFPERRPVKGSLYPGQCTLYAGMSTVKGRVELVEYGGTQRGMWGDEDTVLEQKKAVAKSVLMEVRRPLE